MFDEVVEVKEEKVSLRVSPAPETRKLQELYVFVALSHAQKMFGMLLVC